MFLIIFVAIQLFLTKVYFLLRLVLEVFSMIDSKHSSDEQKGNFKQGLVQQASRKLLIFFYKDYYYLTV